MTRRFSMLLIAALLSAASTVFAGSFQRDYAEALDALAAESYEEAELLLRAVIHRAPASKSKVRVRGMRFEPYVPFLFLGAARLGQGDCAGAIEAWEKEIAQGVAQADPVFERLREGMRTCEATVPEPGRYAIEKSASSAVARDWSTLKTTYGDAVEHFEAGDFAAAEDGLQEAIAVEPRPIDSIRLRGMRFVPYTPYYYLAATRVALGDCAGAEQAWRQAAAAGVALQNPTTAGFPDPLDTCPR